MKRGVTLIESLATMTILIGGIAAIGMTVAATSNLNRRNLRQSQALVLAERELERITQLGCDNVVPLDPCANLKALDGVVLPPVFWAANGKVEAVTTAAAPRARYDVQLDVDPPFEAAETGAPRLLRPLANSEAGSIVNVRVTVSWDDQSRAKQAVALQTRVAP
jgi:type II secretory pathway pseudopilin PulG